MNKSFDKSFPFEVAFPHDSHRIKIKNESYFIEYKVVPLTPHNHNSNDGKGKTPQETELPPTSPLQPTQ